MTLRFVRADGTEIDLGAPTDQVYSFEDTDGSQFHWSVNEARRRAEEHCEIEIISLSEAGMTIERVRSLYVGLDEAYAMTTDLLNPLLFVTYQESHVLIDGWHRVLKALKTGVDILPCFVLCAEDANASLVVSFAPGNGLSWEETPTRIVPERK